MTKRFVIGTDPLTPEQVTQFKNALSGAGWWYWIPNFWLVKDTQGVLTPNIIRDRLFDITRTVRCVVLEVEPQGWAALTRPDSSGRDMAAWLNQTWDT